MIVNLDEAGVMDRLEAAQELPAGPAILERLKDGEEPFFVVPGGTGLEWGVANEIKGSPNRARLKLFVPDGVEDLAVVALRQGDEARARDLLREIVEDATAPVAQQQRLRELLDALGGRGEEVAS